MRLYSLDAFKSYRVPVLKKNKQKKYYVLNYCNHTFCIFMVLSSFP